MIPVNAQNKVKHQHKVKGKFDKTTLSNLKKNIFLRFNFLS